MTDKALQDVSSSEKTLAGFAYFLGLIPALIIWAVKRKESGYIRFNAMQAALFDSLLSLVVMFFIIVHFIGIVIMTAIGIMGISFFENQIGPEPAIILSIIALFFVIIGIGWVSLMSLVMLGLSLVDLVAAYHAVTGKEWRYPVFAGWAEKINQNVQT